ncbi:MAG: hypothetical protein HY747_07850 [Elusimicrobia bacterium]|nr:hypothetical protein [Elusimicrobiota bacterium]
MKVALFVLFTLSALFVGACASTKQTASSTAAALATTASAAKPQQNTFETDRSSVVASAPIAYYLNYEAISARYLQTLITDPALAKAYGGYYPKQNKPLNKLWSSFKKTGDQLTKWASLYPVTAAGVGAYRSVVKTETFIKKELSPREKVAAEVHGDILKATAKAAQERGAQIVFDSQSNRLLYLNPAWDITETAFAALLQTKKDELEKQALSEAEKAGTGKK